jgi:uncharacterized protein YndB with AHSA1/START domain
MDQNNNVTLHRVIKTSPEKLYRAFTESAALAAWLPPYGFICIVNYYESNIGGKYNMKFINFSTGNGHSFSGEYLELKPGEFIRYTDKFDDPSLPGSMQTSVSFKKVMGGTDLNITQEGIPSAIPVEMCYMGWQDSLDKLTRLVEPEIPDN